MATVNNTLYPPVVSTFMPAFVRSKDAVVYFSLSAYNNANDIKRVHVTLQNQNNNENAMRKKPSGILIQTLKFDAEVGLYFVTIPAKLVSPEGFAINQFYKVQLRFDCNSELSNGENDNRYISNIAEDSGEDSRESEIYSYVLDTRNQTYFSEWSSICLIRPILQPFLSMNNLDSENVATYNKGIIPIVGRVGFGTTEQTAYETETLSSYNIKLIDPTEHEIILQTEEFYTTNNFNRNTINQKIDLQGLQNIQSNSNFILQINITTVNQYTEDFDFPIAIADFLDDENYDPSIIITERDDDRGGVVSNEDGIVVVHVTNSAPLFGTLYVRRSSNLSDFKEWEDIWTDKIAGPIDLAIVDNTVSSLVWYQYSVQLENQHGALTTVKLSHKIFPNFYDAILSREDKQFRLRLNYNVSSVQPVISRTKVDTLGGKYPKFVENATLNYKQFSVSGSLSAMNDENQKFLEQKKYFSNQEYQNFLLYNKERDGHLAYYNEDLGDGITQEAYDRTDYFWEREFRKEALAWLNDGEPKLYRSMTEGSLVVILSDISLTPNQSLSRRVWDFSATIYEVAEADSLSTLDSLGIYKVHKIPETNFRGGDGGGAGSEDATMEDVKPGQLYSFKISAKENSLRDIVMNKLKDYYSGTLAKYMVNDIVFSNVKVFFHDKPHVYWMDSAGNVLSVANSTSVVSQLGYLIDIDTTYADPTLIFVNQRGFYEVPENLEVKDINFYNLGDTVTVEFVMKISIKENLDNIISETSFDKTIIAQEVDAFPYGEWFGQDIRSKFNFYQPEIVIDNIRTLAYTQKMSYFTGLTIEAEPQSYIEIIYQDNKENSFKYLIGFTGVYRLLDGVTIQDIRFLGRRLSYRNFETDGKLLNFQLDLWEYGKDDENNYESVDEIENLKDNFIYMINGLEKIYYKQSWYDFEYESENVIVVKAPVEAIVNYIGNIIKYSF